MNRKHIAGFTLLEVLLALLIFAGLSFSAYEVLHGALRNEEVMRTKSAQLSALQYTMELIEQDFTQIVSRPTTGRNGLSDLVSVSMEGGEGNDSVLMIRANWFNPADLLPRSQLLRCGYRVRDGILQRITYPNIDQLGAETPPARSLLNHVTLFQMRFLYRGQWQRGWSYKGALPDAVEITLDVASVGRIQRIIMLTSGNTDER
ncbi:MAG: type II secretion system minor pseudopilin GspJ [Enterobacteriaceae bacterium]